jgi:hypothetical protein
MYIDLPLVCRWSNGFQTVITSRPRVEMLAIKAIAERTFSNFDASRLRRYVAYDPRLEVSDGDVAANISSAQRP